MIAISGGGIDPDIYIDGIVENDDGDFVIFQREGEYIMIPEDMARRMADIIIGMSKSYRKRKGIEG